MKLSSKRTFPLLAALAVLLISLACRAFVPGAPAALPSAVQVPAENQAAPQVAADVPVQPIIATTEDELLVNLYKLVNPAVVNITVYELNQGVQVPMGQGSGFVFDAEGHIVTNAHVVHGSRIHEVTFFDGTVKEAQLVGEDLSSDLAVIKVDGLPAEVQPLTLGNMDELAVGQTVLAIGNPFGLEGTLTRGIISALGRTIPALNQFSIPASIQTDAAINPGNSGGPLLNLKGEVIGVNAQIETGSGVRANSGVGFAVPVSLMVRVIPALIADGKYDWPWLGVRGGSVTPALVQAMSLPVEKGAYIADVTTGGPAARAGVRGASREAEVNGRQVAVGGDVVIAINGEPINTFDDLLIFVATRTSPGEEVILTIVRDGKQQEIKLTLGVRPEELTSAGTTPP